MWVPTREAQGYTVPTHYWGDNELDKHVQSTDVFSKGILHAVEGWAQD